LLGGSNPLIYILRSMSHWHEFIERVRETRQLQRRALRAILISGDPFWIAIVVALLASASITILLHYLGNKP
jgi:hypothetical protein